MHSFRHTVASRAVLAGERRRCRVPPRTPRPHRHARRLRARDRRRPSPPHAALTHDRRVAGPAPPLQRVGAVPLWPGPARSGFQLASKPPAAKPRHPAPNEKAPISRGCRKSRRPDSNRGPLHYERKAWRLQAFAERANCQRNACKSSPARCTGATRPKRSKSTWWTLSGRR